jgi:hypothetical protein
MQQLGKKFSGPDPSSPRGKIFRPELTGDRRESMENGQKDVESVREEVNAKWQKHLACWAVRELKKRGQMMDPNGKIRPLPRHRRPTAERLVSDFDEVFPGCDWPAGER